MLALLEELKKTPPLNFRQAHGHQPDGISLEQALSKMPNVIQRRSDGSVVQPKKVYFTKTGSRLIGLVKKRTGERVI